MFKKMPADEIEKLVHGQIVGRLGCHADDLTYVVPISYGYDGLYIYARTFEGKKLEMLRKNPKVCFQVDDTHDLSNWQSVICWGQFEELKGKEERDQAIRVLQGRRIPLVPSKTMELSPDSPFPASSEETPGVIFRIRIDEKTGMSEISLPEYHYST